MRGVIFLMAMRCISPLNTCQWTQNNKVKVSCIVRNKSLFTDFVRTLYSQSYSKNKFFTRLH